MLPAAVTSVTCGPRFFGARGGGASRRTRIDDVHVKELLIRKHRTFYVQRDLNVDHLPLAELRLQRLGLAWLGLASEAARPKLTLYYVRQRPDRH